MTNCCGKPVEVEGRNLAITTDDKSFVTCRSVKARTVQDGKMRLEFEDPMFYITDKDLQREFARIADNIEGLLGETGKLDTLRWGTGAKMYSGVEMAEIIRVAATWVPILVGHAEKYERIKANRAKKSAESADSCFLEKIMLSKQVQDL